MNAWSVSVVVIIRMHTPRRQQQAHATLNNVGSNGGNATSDDTSVNEVNMMNCEDLENRAKGNL